EWTTSLLTNREVIEVDQHSTKNHPVVSNSDRSVWVAQSTTGKGYYVAVFNLKSSEEEFTYSWSALEIPAAKYKVRNLWLHQDIGTMDSLRVKLPPHGSVLYAVAAVQ
ncbi:MAG TPA: glycoside hydrolase family 27 protein, partial [Terriglobales bacterium]